MPKYSGFARHGRMCRVAIVMPCHELPGRSHITYCKRWLDTKNEHHLDGTAEHEPYADCGSPIFAKEHQWIRSATA